MQALLVMGRENSETVPADVFVIISWPPGALRVWIAGRPALTLHSPLRHWYHPSDGPACYMDCVAAASRRDGVAGSHHAGRRQTRLPRQATPTRGILGRASRQVPIWLRARRPAGCGRFRIVISRTDTQVDTRGLPVPEATPRPFRSCRPRCAAERRCGHGAPAAATRARSRRVVVPAVRPPRYLYRSTWPGHGDSGLRWDHCRCVLATACLLALASYS